MTYNKESTEAGGSLQQGAENKNEQLELLTKVDESSQLIIGQPKAFVEAMNTKFSDQNESIKKQNELLKEQNQLLKQQTKQNEVTHSNSNYQTNFD
ncbi:hypothetical protein MOUN0_M03994 [Monosporozyma unispora]|nr:hypothetical protein C6P44_002872 [Kazachstania unispora]